MILLKVKGLILRNPTSFPDSDVRPQLTHHGSPAAVHEVGRGHGEKKEGSPSRLENVQVGIYSRGVPSERLSRGCRRRINVCPLQSELFSLALDVYLRAH